VRGSWDRQNFGVLLQNNNTEPLIEKEVYKDCGACPIAD
jgi:hypothetical protein